MARPKKGTKAGEIATSKWMETMLKKYGGESGFRKKMSEVGAKGGRNGHSGGFASNRELARTAGAKGGRIGRRDEAKKWYDEHREQIMRMKAKGMNTYQIAKAISGCRPQRVYYVMSKYGGEE